MAQKRNKKKARTAADIQELSAKRPKKPGTNSKHDRKTLESANSKSRWESVKEIVQKRRKNVSKKNSRKHQTWWK